MRADTFKPKDEWPGRDVEAQIIMLWPPAHVQYMRRAYSALISPIEGQSCGVMTRKSHEIFDKAAVQLETVEQAIAEALEFGSQIDDYNDEAADENCEDSPEIVRTTPEAAYLAEEVNQAIEARKDAKVNTQRPAQKKRGEVALLILGPVFSSFDESLCTVYGSSPNVQAWSDTWFQEQELEQIKLVEPDLVIVDPAYILPTDSWESSQGYGPGKQWVRCQICYKCV